MAAERFRVVWNARGMLAASYPLSREQAMTIFESQLKADGAAATADRMRVLAEAEYAKAQALIGPDGQIPGGQQ